MDQPASADPARDRASLPEQLENRVYEVLLELPAATSGPAFAALLAAHPEHRAALLRLQASLRGAESALQDTGLVETPTARSIGPYRLVRRLGEGGFGVVWLAEQHEPLQRLVALKLIRAGMHTAGVLRRFESERELLARLDHPYIARVLDAGEDDTGCPYLVTEYVPGDAITRFCSERDLALVARLELFVRVCDGVQHAHQRGVIHRDLKPSNVLAAMVDGVPVPKVIDFGIARAAGGTAGAGVTREGMLVGTPEYMSPEQAQGTGDVDIRTDVFALGVMLYELLVGDLPQGRDRWRSAGLTDLLAMIRHEQAPRPSTKAPTTTLARQLRTDLDWVVLKALDKDRERRYGTVAELAQDVRAVLEHRPVQAGPPRLLYQVRKFARRHRVEVTFAGLALLSLCAGLVATVWLWRESQHSGEQAAAAAQLAETHLDNYQHLANVVELRDLQATAATLPPPGEREVHYGKWLARARTLLDSRAPIVAALATVQQRLAGERANPADAFLATTLAAYLADLEHFAATKGPLADVEQRLAWAQKVHRVSFVEHEAQWTTAIAAIAVSPRYGGLRLAPQLGLVPLGEDEASGLWEFLHLQSGGPPRRDARGRLDPASGIVLVLLPGGTATIGAQSGDASKPHFDPEAGKRHAVQTVTLRPFFVAKYEMTRAQWERIVGDKPWFFTKSFMTGSHPAENLSWEMADAAMRRLDLALPTDAQWEYACRAGTTTIWSCGDDPALLGTCANLAGTETKGLDVGPDRFSPEHHDPHVVTAPVGSMQPNAFGLHDMHGNIGEACADSVVDHSGPLRDGDGLREGGDPRRTRAMRGGAFSERTELARSMAWADVVPDSRVVQLGVRPARPLDD